MKRLGVMVVFLLAFLFAAKCFAQSAELQVTELVVSAAVLDRTPVDVRDRFPSDIKTVWCFSRIKVDVESAVIYHVWYYNNEKQFQIGLNLKRAPGFRTYSSKGIMEHQKGEWRVDVTDADGNVLKSVSFKIE